MRLIHLKIRYIYIIPPLCSVHGMCSLKQKTKTPCRMRGITLNIHKVIKPTDCNKLEYDSVSQIQEEIFSLTHWQLNL